MPEDSPLNLCGDKCDRASAPCHPRMSVSGIHILSNTSFQNKDPINSFKLGIAELNSKFEHSKFRIDFDISTMILLVLNRWGNDVILIAEFQYRSKSSNCFLTQRRSFPSPT